MIKKRSGTKFIMKSKCNCKNQRLLVQGFNVLCICPHFEPYRVYLENPLEMEVTDGYLKKGTPFTQVSPLTPLQVPERPLEA